MARRQGGRGTGVSFKDRVEERINREAEQLARTHTLEQLAAMVSNDAPERRNKDGIAERTTIKWSIILAIRLHLQKEMVHG